MGEYCICSSKPRKRVLVALPGEGVGEYLADNRREPARCADAAARLVNPRRSWPKRGGIRAICYWHEGPGAVYMLTAYAKADRDDLSPADRRALVRVVATIAQERQEE